MFLKSFIYHPSVLIFIIKINKTRHLDSQSTTICNKALADYFHLSITENENLIFAQIEERVHPNDKITFRNNISKLLKSPTHYISASIQLSPTLDSKYQNFHTHCILQENAAENSWEYICMLAPFDESDNKTNDDTSLAHLSNREKQVAQLLVIGKTNKEISDTLKISEETVKTHRRNVKKKTNAKNTVQLLQILRNDTNDINIR